MLACLECLYYSCYYTALFAAPVITYLIFFQKDNGGPKTYSTPAWYNTIKIFYAKYRIKKLFKLPKDVMQLQELEDPRMINSNAFSDTYFISGTDQNGNFLSLRVIMLEYKVQVALYFSLKEGYYFTFPDDLGLLTCSKLGNKWKAGGLLIDTIVPFKRLRIIFNGFLLKYNLRNNEKSVEHVQFNFIWTSASRQLLYPQEASLNLLAEAVAREKWYGAHWLSSLDNDDGFWQFGALRGFIKGENFPEPIEFNLASSRKIMQGIIEGLGLHRDLLIHGSAEDGTVFSIGAKSCKIGCSHIKYGNVIFNNLKVFPVDRLDIVLPHIGEDKDIPEIFTVNFGAKDREFKCVLHLNNSASSTVCCNDKFGWELVTVPAECDFNNLQARAIVSFWYKRRGEKVAVLEPLLTDLIPEFNPKDYVLDLSSVEARILSLTGGKANSLALLTSLNQKEFHVPPGIVITVSAFHKQLSERPVLSKAIDLLNEIARGDFNADFSEACSSIVDLFSQESVCNEIAGVIAEKLKELLNGENWKWAVRSSGIGEDSEELSAAGQNATFLGCASIPDVLKAVAACWGSLFTFQSVQYRRQHGLPIQCDMGVVVQRMVPADSAGVLFTCHPTTGNTGEMIITSNYGLGESVVSGLADPDSIILTKTWKSVISIKEKVLGTKGHVIRMINSGIETLKTEDDAGNFSLNNEQIIRLGKIGVYLEEKFGGPRDIEWAFHENEVYVLQSRPITTLNAWSDFEITHEFDDAVLSDKNMYTKANCGEVMPGALTTLTLSSVILLTDKAYQVKKSGYYNPYLNEALFRANQQVFIDVINGVYLDSPKAEDIAVKVRDLAIFGHPVFDEKIETIAESRFGTSTFIRKTADITSFLYYSWINKKLIAKFIRMNNEFGIYILETDSPIEMYEKIDKYMDVYFKQTLIHMNSTNKSIFCEVMTMIFLAEKNSALTTDHYSDIALILSSCDSVISAEVPKILEKIAYLIQKQKLPDQFVLQDPKDGVEWLKYNCPDAYEEFKGFMENHGHRSFREFEVMAQSWEAEPEKIIEMIQATSRCEITTEKPKALSAEETVARLKTPKSNITRKILKFLVKKCRIAVGERELTKSELVKSINKLRKAYRQLSVRMEKDGILPRKELIYHLTHQEIKQILLERNPSLISKAFRRERLYPQLDKLKFPEISYGAPKPINEKIPTQIAPGDVIEAKGTPVCSADIVARACVVMDIKEIGQLQAGDILVTYSTDIGWSPYFPMLGGVITELGGVISHGAVVAREYGLPCIVGVKNATTVFKTGDIIALSGKTGLITVVS